MATGFPDFPNTTSPFSSHPPILPPSHAIRYFPEFFQGGGRGRGRGGNNNNDDSDSDFEDGGGRKKTSKAKAKGKAAPPPPPPPSRALVPELVLCSSGGKVNLRIILFWGGEGRGRLAPGWYFFVFCLAPSPSLGHKGHGRRLVLGDRTALLGTEAHCFGPNRTARERPWLRLLSDRVHLVLGVSLGS